ncbi:MAG: helix-turn-helix domain-containing protein [Lachnospiraceae bacterium]|nr:helix-turn-helix domain-containing protein [Lachnospiraceae bacterium]
MEGKKLFGKCPYYTSQKILTGKWALYIMFQLREHKIIRFNELQRLMPDDMTHTTLSRQLKSLEESGLIIRKEYSQIPPKVEYSLSEIGSEFDGVLNALGDWGDKYNQFLQNGQKNKIV